MHRISLILAAFLILPVSLLFANKPAARDFYQIKIYHLKSAAQEKQVDDFLQSAYLPALHRAGIAKVGVFKLIDGLNTDSKIAKPDEKLVYVFIPFKSSAQFHKLEQQLEKDAVFQREGKSYLDAIHTATPYERIESILLTAFDGNPRFNIPKLGAAKKDRIYELRSYEGGTEKLYQNKVDMFNQGGEVAIFDNLGFNAMFYGEVISGSRMPNLMYMTTFENKADRDAHWKSFGNDPSWEKLKVKPEYQNNVSKIDTLFLYPTEYSDI